MTDPAPDPDPGDDRAVEAAPGPPTSTPRWVKVFGGVALVIVLLLVIMALAGGGGGHGPGRHFAPSNVTDLSAQP